MMTAVLYILAGVAAVMGTAAYWGALNAWFPVSWLYYHAHTRKPVVWLLLLTGAALTTWTTIDEEAFPTSAVAPLVILVLALWFSYWFHQDAQFVALDYPEMSKDPLSLPLRGEMHLAVIEHDGVTRAYPLDWVIHHHIVNDRIGNSIISLTYCAHCRSIMPFDVTDIGPLYVASFKQSNMIVGDRRTGTFFQQATMESIIGKHHPSVLKPVFFQILSWTDVQRLDPMPEVAHVTPQDVKGMDFAVPGTYEKLMTGEHTLGLPKRKRDNTFHPRTRVVGILDRTMPDWTYLRNELLQQKVVHNADSGFFLVALNGAVNGFLDTADGHPLTLEVTVDQQLRDQATGTVWDLRGQHLSGPVRVNLTPLALSDEYWFSWKLFHPDTRLVRLGRALPPGGGNTTKSPSGETRSTAAT